MLSFRCWAGYSDDFERDLQAVEPRRNGPWLDVVTLPVTRAFDLERDDPTHERALFAAQRAIELNPNFALGYFALGETHVFMGNFSETIDPICVVCVFLLGTRWLLFRQSDRAGTLSPRQLQGGRSLLGTRAAKTAALRRAADAGRHPGPARTVRGSPFRVCRDGGDQADYQGHWMLTSRMLNRPMRHICWMACARQVG